jgi:hypothetical protein
MTTFADSKPVDGVLRLTAETSTRLVALLNVHFKLELTLTLKPPG